MEKQIKFSDILIVGFALFAMFLGAGNIIFPPYMGAHAGSKWLLAGFGFILTGTSLPMFGILAAAKAGGDANAVASRVSLNFAKLLNTLILLFIGPLFAVPRTSATTVELSIHPFLPAEWSKTWILAVGSAIFFAAVLYFVLNPSNAVDNIGKYMTPLLVIFLLTLIFLSIFKPIGTPVAPSEEVLKSGIFHSGFTTGYQTMDALGSIIFCGTVFSSLLAKGYSQKQGQKMMVPIALICGLGTATVYTGFTWIGASGSASLQAIGERTALTVASVDLLAGIWGRLILAAIIFLACFTTAIGLLMTAAQYFTDSVFRKRFSYRSVALVMALISYAISIIGVDGIISLAAPILELVYPPVIILIILNLFFHKMRYRHVYYGALLFCLPPTILNVLRVFNATKPLAESCLGYFPLGLEGFGAFVPAAIGGLLAYVYARYLERQGRLTEDMRTPEDVVVA